MQRDPLPGLQPCQKRRQRLGDQIRAAGCGGGRDAVIGDRQPQPIEPRRRDAFGKARRQLVRFGQADQKIGTPVPQIGEIPDKIPLGAPRAGDNCPAATVRLAAGRLTAAVR